MIASSYQIEQSGPNLVITIKMPQVDGMLMQEVTEELTSRMRLDNATRFIFDLAEVQYLSSDCLGVLVSFLQELEMVRGRVVLANCSSNVAFLFKVTRLEDVFPIFEDVPEAEAALHAA